MGEEREDPQKLKRIVAAAYDYENDPKWADYWSNILIPPHVASRSDVVDHFKRKFYQRYVDPDLVVEALLSSTPSQSVKPSASLSTSSLAGNAGAQARNTGSTSRSSGASAASGSHTTSVRWDRQTIQFSVNAWVFIVALLAIFPLVPSSLSNRAYRLSFMGTICSSLYSLYALYGRSSAWNLQAIQVYFQSIIATKDFIYFIYCLTFVTSHLCLKCGSTISYKLSCTGRSLLKLMYHAPVTAGYHQSVRVKIGRTVNRPVQRYAPFLNAPVSAIQRWWLR
ncbi:hypothetical protein CRYUN_Cryun20dG0049300 [Craigia yunnanensis]